jgi:AmmeMemoRadiSam system protein B
MAVVERPALRSLKPYRYDGPGGPSVVFDDPLGFVDPQFAVPLPLYLGLIRHFDGSRTADAVLRDRAEVEGIALTPPELDALVERLDEACVLDGPTFAEAVARFRAAGVRPAAMAGRCYPSSDRALRAQLGSFFSHADGAGWPRASEVGPRDDRSPVRGILSPHIDFARGGHTYTWAYRALLERCPAEVFVILGAAHQPCQRRFVLTYKDFETPLGVARTDRSFVRKLAALAGEELFDDEIVHRTEHSIEFQVVFLQYILGPRRDFSIVPILVGSFHDLMHAALDPIEQPEIRRFVQALRAAESASERPVAYIGGIDLAHLGPEFGDPGPVTAQDLQSLRQFDSTLLHHAASSDPEAWFRHVAQTHNRYRICGLSTTYTMLHAMGPTRGQLLRYGQSTSSDRRCCVSYASVAFVPSDDAEAPT